MAIWTGEHDPKRLQVTGESAVKILAGSKPPDKESSLMQRVSSGFDT